jgi:hypothetical protein
MTDGRPVSLPVGVSTGIGSLPHFDPSDAVDFVLRHAPRLPFAPSLPARSRREGMIPQAASGLAGVEVQDDGSLVLDEASIDPDRPIDAAFGGDAFVGLRAFLTAVSDRDGPMKLSITGPVTLGIALHAAGLAADLAFRVAGNATAQRARALVDYVGQRVPFAQLVVFVDEPSLVSVTDRSFPIAPGDAVDLVSTTLATIEPFAVTGLHCCGPADWRLVLQAGPQLLSLPIDAGAERAAGALADHVERGGWMAWGAVPTDRPIGSTVDRLWRQLSVLWCDLVGAGCDPVRLRTQAMITPACGLARHGVTQAEQVMGFTTRLAERLHDQAIGVRLSVGA